MKKPRPNWSLFTGLVMGLVIIGVALIRSSSTPWIFMNLVGFSVVIGGMCASSLIMFPFRELVDLSRSLYKCCFHPTSDSVDAVTEMVRLGQTQNENPHLFTWNLEGISHSLARDGVELLASGIKPDEIRRRLELIAEHTFERSLGHSGALLSFAKLGPGFGLMGTLLGLVVLLQEMGAHGNFDRVGPALAISLLATLYGVVSSNLFLQPLAELVRNRAEQDLKIDQLIIDGIGMLKEKRHPLQIRDALRSHLSWDENTALDLALDISPGRGGNREAA